MWPRFTPFALLPAPSVWSILIAKDSSHLLEELVIDFACEDCSSHAARVGFKNSE